MRRRDAKTRRNSHRPLAVELADRYPDRVVQLHPKKQKIIALARLGRTSAEIAKAMRMKPPAVRKQLERACCELKRDQKSSSFVGLLLSFVSIKSPVSDSGSVATAHAHSGTTISMAGLVGAGAVALGVFSLSVPIEFPVLRSEIPAIHANTPASVGVVPADSRRPVADDDKSSATQPGPMEAHSPASMSVSSTTSRLPQASLPARGQAQLSPDLTGGEQGAQEFSADSPAGDLIVENKLETTGSTTAWRACTRIDASTCEKAHARIAPASRSRVSLPGS